MPCRNYTGIVQVGFGKSGTTTVADFFVELGYNATCGFQMTAVLAAALEDRRQQQQQRPFETVRRLCPRFYISELSRVYFPNENIHLQLTDMSALRRAADPADTLFVHCQRTTADWVRSVRAWGSLNQRLTVRDIEGLPPGHGGSAEELARWYDAANAYLAFAFAYRTNYVHVQTDSNASLADLSEFCGRGRGRVFPILNSNPRSRATVRTVQ